MNDFSEKPNPRAYVLRWLFSILFGLPLVALIDFSGETNVRVVWRDALGRASAHRHGFGIRTVRLLPGGGVQNGCYVDRWVLLRGKVSA